MKLTPAKSGESVTVSPKRGPGAGTKFTTPGGTPASLNILNMVQLESMAVSDGFQSVALPIRVGVTPRLAPMAVKLKGDMDAMNPSRARYSTLFQTWGAWTDGWPCVCECVWREREQKLSSIATHVPIIIVDRREARRERDRERGQRIVLFLRWGIKCYSKML